MLIRWNVWKLAQRPFAQEQFELSVQSWRQVFPDATLVVYIDRSRELPRAVAALVDEVRELKCDLIHLPSSRSSWAKWYPFGRCSDGPELYVDGDIIAVGCCEQIKRWAADDASPPVLCSQECNGRCYYGEWRKIMHTKKPWNAGLVGQKCNANIGGEMLSWAAVNRWLFGHASSRGEQVAVAAYAEMRGAEPLDPKRFIICSRSQNNGLQQLAGLDTIHFTCGNNNANWPRLLPRIRQHLRDDTASMARGDTAKQHAPIRRDSEGGCRLPSSID